jgi:probable F420-dependent oxidoreductase
VPLPRLGVFAPELRIADGAAASDAAAELEAMGYGAVWCPGGPDGGDVVAAMRRVLEATSHLIAAPAVVNVHVSPPHELAAVVADLDAAHPGRFLLGLGVSHEQLVDKDQPGRYSRPRARMEEYLSALDSGPNPVPPAERVLAALGPRMLALARDRSAGAHPYFVTVEHTQLARDVLGPERLLASEQAVVLEMDPVRARAIGRQHLSRYLQMPNYTNNWLRLGFTADDLAGGGSDRLVDGLVAWGTTEAIRNRIADHHLAGADHVCMQVVTEDDAALPRDEWRTLAAALRSPSVRR